MEILVGPTFEIAGSGSYVRDRTQSQSQSQSQEKISSSSCLFLKEEDDGVGAADQAGEGTGSDLGLPDLSSDSSSSIGAPGDSDEDAEDEDEDGVVSSGGNGGLASLGSIEDSLPIKRGLSNHFSGKSKSFANLSDISSVKDLPKPENPFNKKRRILLAKKWSRKSFYTWQNPNSMPLLALNEQDEEDGDDKETSSSILSLSNDKASATQKPKLQQSKLRISFKSQSCFSLTDLQVEEEHQ